jgi:hypothetical protein
MTNCVQPAGAWSSTRRPCRGGLVRLITAVTLLAIEAGCSNRPSSSDQVTPGDADASDRVAASQELDKRVQAFCGDCHALPEPDTFPRDAWFAEVEQGYRLYHESGRSDLDPPAMKEVVAWYRERAPASLEIVPTSGSPYPSPLKLTAQHIPPPDAQTVPGLSNLRWWRDGDGKGRLIVTDMNSGQIHSVQFDGRAVGAILSLGDGHHPARAQPHDLDGDGASELLVAGLGSALPADHQQGSILALSLSDPTRPPVTLLSGVGRIADVRPGDFTGDGITDLIVAEFGWRKTGSLLLLEGAPGDPLKFEPRSIDERPGGIHVVPVDLDSDGDLDFVALISQEHEQIVAYINQGSGEFHREVIFDAGDPSYGSSGIQLVDLDGDGDLDVLYTNGDTLDSEVLKPYHAVHWLENKGGFPYVCHTIVDLPGAARALAGDLDGDGDLDIAACVFVTPQILHSGSDSSLQLPSLLWLENNGSGFETHLLEIDACHHLCLEIGDFDDDGRLDLAVGNFLTGIDSSRSEWLRIWWNDGPLNRE